MSSDPRSDDPFRPAAGPDDVTSTDPVAPTPAEAAPLPAQSAWAAPNAPTGVSDPFDRPVATSPVAAAPVGSAPLGSAPFGPGPVSAAPVRAKGGSGMLVNVLLAVALVVAVGGVAFAVGRVTAPATTASGRTGFGTNGQGGFGPNASGAPGAGFNGGFGGFGGGNVSIQGTVTAVTADSITIQLAGGQSITIPTNAQTTYRESQASTAAAVTSGATVLVQLPAGRGAFGNGNGNGNGNGGQGGGPNASGAPGRTLGPASTITVIPAGG